MPEAFAAVDLGASSGRVVTGRLEGDRVALTDSEMQSALGAPPQHIVGAACPLMRYQVVDLGGVKRVAEKRSQIPGRLRLAKDSRRTRPMAADQRSAQGRGQRGIPPGEIALEGGEATARHVSAR